MEKEIYFTPEMEVTEFECEDVIGISSIGLGDNETPLDIVSKSSGGNWES
jgi:hypothetical protein